MPPGFGLGRAMRGGDGPPGKLDFKRLKKHFRPFLQPHLKAMGLGLACVVLISLLGKMRPLLTRYMVDQVALPFIKEGWTDAGQVQALRLLSQVILIMLMIALASAGLTCLRTRVIRRAGINMIRRLREFVYRHLQGLSLSFFESRRTGDIMSRITGDVSALERIVTDLGDRFLNECLSLAVTVLILFWLDWRLALCALSPVPFMILHMRLFSGKIRPLYRRVRDRHGSLNARLQDNLSGIRVIKSFHTEEEENKNFMKENDVLCDVQLDGVKIWSVAFPMIHLITAGGALMVSGVGFYLMFKPEQSVSLGTLTAFNSYVMHLYQPIGHLFHMFNSLLQSFAAGERVAEILEAKPDVADAPGARELPPVRGEVKFENVCFGYNPGARVLHGINALAKPGQTIALVGRSGAGKTSFINLIPRFYDPNEGRIMIDGHDLRHVSQSSLRSQIGVVLQDPFLFNSSVADNIRYARPEASSQQIQAAAEAANAHEFIARMPLGYDTQIGERGVKLSGGQKQRLSIARALLADRRILVLDEATSMVDSHSELLIQQALEKLLQGRTTFVIAHRLSTVRRADLILVLDQGRIHERGTHDELIARNRLYAEMYRTQFYSGG